MDSQPLSARRASPLSAPPCAHLSASVFIPARCLARPVVALLSFAVAVAASDFFPGRSSSDPPSVVAFTHPLPSSRPFPPSLRSRRSSFPSAAIPPLLSPSLSSSFSCRLQEVSVRFVRV